MLAELLACRPTLEGVQAMTKMVRQEAEKGKTSVRSVRHKALEAIKKSFKAVDDRKRFEKEVGCARTF